MITHQIDKYQEVDYDDSIHRYFLGDTPYLSATQLVEKFCNPFDANKWLNWMVYKHGSTIEYWKEKWKKINTTSLERGNTIHKIEEDLVPDPRKSHTFSCGKVITLPYSQYPSGVYAELKLWRHDWKIAGRADRVVLHPMTMYDGNPPFKYPFDYRIADVEDHKTNACIEMQSYKDMETKERIMMLRPLEHLMDCNYYHYSLQLSIYQYMLEYFGFMPGHRRIIHHPHPIPDIPGIPTPRILELPYLRNEVKAMLKYLNKAA